MFTHVYAGYAQGNLLMLTSRTLLPRLPSAAAASAQSYGKPESLRLLNMWGIEILKWNMLITIMMYSIIYWRVINLYICINSYILAQPWYILSYTPLYSVFRIKSSIYLVYTCIYQLYARSFFHDMPYGRAFFHAMSYGGISQMSAVISLSYTSIGKNCCNRFPLHMMG